MHALKIKIGFGPWQAVTGTADFSLTPGEVFSVDLASGGHWYGHGFSHVQPYPLETCTLVNPFFATHNIRSPIWMCSAGFALLAEAQTAFEIRLNEAQSGVLTIRSLSTPVTLHIFQGKYLPQAHAALMAHLGWPSPPPPATRFGDCLFCTWTQYPRAINQERVLDMARQIRQHGYPCSTLILDDRWESAVGDLAFSPTHFPDPKGMVETLRNQGFSVWLWVTPFVNEDSTSFPELADRGFLVREKNSREIARVRWWGGTAGVLDLTRPETREWFQGRLSALRMEKGIEGFKVDGGDVTYLPSRDTAEWHSDPGPYGYADILISLLADVVPHRCETRTAWLAQHYPILWREGGKDSRWGEDNGLRALVHAGLHLSLMGYDILIPDMVPGRVRTVTPDAPLPTDELMIRWTEASAFMPILQFSYFPWNYQELTASIVLAYARLHKELESYLAAQAAKRHAPLFRPIWYDHFSENRGRMRGSFPFLSSGRRGVMNAQQVRFEEALYTVGDEWMLGSHILVAPVLSPGVTSRDVYLPAGSWTDAWDLSVHSCGCLSDYPAPCPGMPIFVRSHSHRLVERLHRILKTVPRGSVPSGLTTACHGLGIHRDFGDSDASRAASQEGLTV